MDGFLLVAQYSPLLNGRPFGVDLPGDPSRREDWEALFDEYFHPTANLTALEESAAEISRSLDVRAAPPVKVVLTIPTPDPRCTDWDGRGRSLADASERIAVTSWAMDELLSRWRKAGYRRLKLAGFYYMTEQGSWNDPVLHSFSRRCRGLRLRSFAIPGITSSWMTEFNRAGVRLRGPAAFPRLFPAAASATAPFFEVLRPYRPGVRYGGRDRDPLRCGG